MKTDNLSRTVDSGGSVCLTPLQLAVMERKVNIAKGDLCWINNKYIFFTCASAKYIFSSFILFTFEELLYITFSLTSSH